MSQLSPQQTAELLNILQTRFETNKLRHPSLKWPKIEAKLEADPKKLWSLNEMEKTGGEPDVVELPSKNSEIMFIDCAKQSPTGRRSLCYDRAAWEYRKQNKPVGNAVDMANQMGVEILNEAEYYELQKFDDLDLTTTSWVQTPESIRKLGGGIYCTIKYGRVWTYHNGAESYYAARGFRGILKF